MTLFSKIKSAVVSLFSDSQQVETEKPSPPLGSLTSGVSSLRSILGIATENPDKILKEKGVKIYDEMEGKDGHLYSVYQTRKLAVSRIPWVIEPASDSKRDKEIADFVFTVLSDCKGPLSEDIFQLMDAVGKGFSCLEIKWKLIKQGKWAGKFGLQELVFHSQKFWSFENAKNSENDTDSCFFGMNALDRKKIPWSKVIHMAFDSQDSLYGRAAFRTIYWHWWFKKESWKWWIQYLEKYAGPTAIGKFPMGSSSKQVDDLLATLESIQQETAVAIPDQLSVDLLEASRSGPASYREMSDAVNAELSKAILGATQTVEEGRRGSYSLSRSHSQVRQERVEADGILVADTIQEQLVKRIVDFNFVTDSYPQFLLKYPFDSVDSRSKGKTISLPSYFK